MNTSTTSTRVPPGFRFHPTDEELVDYYLRRKVASKRIDLDVIKDVDLYKIEPWDLQELCRIGSEEQNEQWYFFSHKDKKYPTGTRTNRATSAGFWKATGRDKAIYSKREIVGMRKTLVFYKGRAPNGQKSDWIMHEYRLETDENGTTQEEGWVVCKVFKKRIATSTVRRLNERGSPNWGNYDDQVSNYMDSPRQHINHHPMNLYPDHYASCKKEMITSLQYGSHHFLQLPNLETTAKFLHHPQTQTSCMDMLPSAYQTLGDQMSFQQRNNNSEQVATTDWRVLDKFVASQLSQDDISHENDENHVNKQQVMMEVMENGSTSSSSCQIDHLWK